MPDLETRLRALADEAAWPETPDLTGSVAAALAAGRGAGVRPPRTVRRRRRGLVAAAVAALVLVPAAGAAAFPDARDDVLEWLGLSRTEVRRTPTPPAARPPAAPDLGTRLGLERAARRAGFRPLAPAGLGAPDAVHLAGLGAADRVTLVYRPRPGLPAMRGLDAGLLVTQVRGRLEGPLLEKVAGATTQVRRVSVDGRPGALFTGGPHVYLYLDPAGQVVEDRPWRAGNTLVLERDGTVIRLEVAAAPATLLRLARSLRISPLRAP
jgi:hypothetical protein